MQRSLFEKCASETAAIAPLCHLARSQAMAETTFADAKNVSNQPPNQKFVATNCISRIRGRGYGVCVWVRKSGTSKTPLSSFRTCSYCSHTHCLCVREIVSSKNTCSNFDPSKILIVLTDTVRVRSIPRGTNHKHSNFEPLDITEHFMIISRVVGLLELWKWKDYPHKLWRFKTRWNQQMFIFE